MWLAPALEASLLRNAIIESCCIHARGLIEFFQKESKHPQFTQGYTAFAINSNAVDNIRKRLNIQIAHLIFDGRTADDSEKIDHPERLKAAQFIAAEVPIFKAALLPGLSHVAIRDVVLRNELQTAPGVSPTNSIIAVATEPSFHDLEVDVTSKTVTFKTE